MYNPIRELKEAVNEMQAAGLSKKEMVLEAVCAVLIFSPILLLLI